MMACKRHRHSSVMLRLLHHFSQARDVFADMCGGEDDAIGTPPMDQLLQASVNP